jgi:hypothetical protein
LNPRFYYPAETPQALENEIASAEFHFLALIQYFCDHYITVLDGVVIDGWYIVKRMLAEFAAAVVVFSQQIDEFQRGDVDMDIDGEEADVIPPSKVKVKVDDIIARSYPEVMAYYLNCVATCHKRFTWTGPPVTIFPRSEAWDLAKGVIISGLEKPDHQMHPIFMTNTAPSAPDTSNPSLPATLTKRRGSVNDDNAEAKKQRL